MDKLDTPLDEVIAMETGDGGGNGGAVRGSRPRKGGGPAPGGKVCFFSAKGTFAFFAFFFVWKNVPTKQRQELRRARQHTPHFRHHCCIHPSASLTTGACSSRVHRHLPASFHTSSIKKGKKYCHVKLTRPNTLPQTPSKHDANIDVIKKHRLPAARATIRVRGATPGPPMA